MRLGVPLAAALAAALAAHDCDGSDAVASTPAHVASRKRAPDAEMERTRVLWAEADAAVFYTYFAGRTTAAAGLRTRASLLDKVETRGWEQLETDSSTALYSSYAKDDGRLNFWLTALACFVVALARTCWPRANAMVEWWLTAPANPPELARPECPLCFECFCEDSAGARVPRILRCGHSACHGCYSHMLRRVQVETGREAKPLVCPVCKDVTQVRDGQADSLPKVYSLLRL